jgi:TadE-like protein
VRQWLRAWIASASRGQAAVETALILSIVMVLALGTLDLGRGIAAHVALNEATQEGAMVAGYRYCDPDVTFDVAHLRTLIQTSSSAEAVTQATVPLPDVTEEYITVRSSYPMPVLTPLASFIFGPTIAIGVEVDATNFHEDCT